MEANGTVSDSSGLDIGLHSDSVASTTSESLRPTSGPEGVSGDNNIRLEALIANKIDLYGGGFILFVGTFSNLLAIVVLRRKRMWQNSASLYFLVLAVTDLIMVVGGQAGRHWVRALTGIDPPALHTAYCKVWYLVINYASGYSNWILAGVSVERAIAILAPLKAKRLLQRKQSLTYLVVTLVMNLVYYSHSAFSYLTKTTEANGRIFNVCTADVTKYFVTSIRPWSDLVFKGLIPGAMIVISNAIIIWKLASARMKRRALSAGGSNSSDTYSKTSSVVRMVVAISVAFVILTLPYHVTYILTTSYPAGYQVAGREAAVYRLVWAVNIFLLYVNHSVNFFFYLLSGADFRNELMAWLLEMCGCAPSHATSAFHSQTSASHSQISVSMATTAVSVDCTLQAGQKSRPSESPDGKVATPATDYM